MSRITELSKIENIKRAAMKLLTECRYENMTIAVERVVFFHKKRASFKETLFVWRTI